MIRMAVAMVAMLLLVSCAARLPLKERDVSSLIQMTDDKKNRRIGVKLTNDSPSKWCIDDGDWPNHIGALDQLGDPSSGYAVTLTIDGTIHPVKQRNLGYCVGNCKIVVKPGETIAAEIPYSEFSVADDEVEKEKSLGLPIAAVLCR